MKHAIEIWNRIPKSVPRKQRTPILAMVLALSIAMTMPAQAAYEKGVQAWESGQYREALIEWMSAANADDGRAMLEIGRAYQQGRGVLQDYVEAHKWLNLAAGRGVQGALEERDALSAGMTLDDQAKAQNLARQWHLERGAATPSAYEKGVQAWESGQYREALTEWMSSANADDGRAMLEIGRAYQQGLGVLQDYVEAYKWFNLAASRGVSDALEERDALSARMTLDDQAKAQKLARQWHPEGGAATPSASVADTDTVLVVNPEPPPEAIREAQALLRALGYRPGPADGLWGQRTGVAYRSFLQDKGMPTSETLGIAALLAMRDIAKAQGIDETSLRAAVTPDALHQAAKAGDITTLKAALDAGADVNRLDGKGWTALMHAVNKGNVLIVESLVEIGVDVDVQAPDGATALFMAAVLGHPKIIELLMKANADISIQGPKGMTAVDAARLTLGEPAAVREQGMDSAVVGLVEGISWKETLARQNEVTRKFVDSLGRNPSAEAVDEYGRTDLHWAAIMNAVEVAKVLITQGADVNAKDEDGWTALHWAAEGNAFEVAEVLIAHGADVNAKNNAWHGGDDGDTPLHETTGGNAVEVAKLLIAHGADVNAKGELGGTPLHETTRGDSVEVAEVLIAHGADVNAKGNAGSTPLGWAATWNGVEVAKLLIAHGADVNAKSNTGGTPLHGTTSYEAFEVAKLLIAHGADVNAKNYEGETPLYKADDSVEMLKLFHRPRRRRQCKER